MMHYALEDEKSSRGHAAGRLGRQRAWPWVMGWVCAGVLLGVGNPRADAQPVAPAGEPPVQVPGNRLPSAPMIQQLPGPDALSHPGVIPPFGKDQIRLPRLPCSAAGVFGCTPHPGPHVVEDYGKFVKQVICPECTLDVIVGRTYLMVLDEPPRRVQIADDAIAGYTLMSLTELSILGKSVGSTVLTLWFPDPKDKTKQKVLTYLVRVFPDPEAKERLEKVYKCLEAEINRVFPDSRICLVLAGDKLIVSGQAKDVADANHIIQVIRANLPGGQRSTQAERTAQIPVDLARAAAPPATAQEAGASGVIPGALLQRAIDQVFGPGRTPTTELYVVSGTPDVVNLLRVPGEQQVCLQVTVAEVDRAAARSIGLNFNIFNNNGVLVAGQNVGGLANGGLGNGFGLFGFGFGQNGNFFNFAAGSPLNNIPVALDNGQIQLAIAALRELHYARSLAEPNLVTLNGQTANFQAGGLFPVPYVTGFTFNGLQGVTFIPVGVQLSFTPYVTDKDRIRLSVAAEVSARDLNTPQTFINGTAVPTLTTRNFQTVVELREGQTLAVAGLIQNQISGLGTRVPLLGDLPVVGRLACFDRVLAREQELVILITPDLVHPLEHGKVPPLPGSDLFEPTDLEFYLLGRLESHRQADFRSPVGTDWHRLKKCKECEDMYLSGPHGHSGCFDPVGGPMPHP